MFILVHILKNYLVINQISKLKQKLNNQKNRKKLPYIYLFQIFLKFQETKHKQNPQENSKS